MNSFLTPHFQRLNTSITRAMNLLIIIGNSKALYQHMSWMQYVLDFSIQILNSLTIFRFMDYCKENNAFIGWTGEIPTFK
jgi:hypothetical protein